MWYTILITLVVDFGGLILVYLLLRDRVRRVASAEARIGEIREEVSRLLVELNQATDRNVALMEDRIAVLNGAISTADKKIGLLRRETEKHDVGSRIYSRLAEGKAPRSVEAREEEAREPGGAREPGEARGPQGETWAPAATARAPRSAASAFPPLAVELSERPGATSRPDAAAGPRGQPAAHAAEADDAAAAAPGPAPGRAGDVRQRVMMLFRAGFSPPLIASRVGAPVGEVELIISLEQRKGQA
jgi:hypothetical protein